MEGTCSPSWGPTAWGPPARVLPTRMSPARAGHAPSRRRTSAKAKRSAAARSSALAPPILDLPRDDAPLAPTPPSTCAATGFTSCTPPVSRPSDPSRASAAEAPRDHPQAPGTISSRSPPSWLCAPPRACSIARSAAMRSRRDSPPVERHPVGRRSGKEHPGNKPASSPSHSPPASLLTGAPPTVPAGGAPGGDGGREGGGQ